MQAKLDVIKAGIMLCEKGLIQRTWGNVSCRIDDGHFAITPSGKAYAALTSDDIVIVDTGTLSYTGSIKPSSEKGIHAACYALRPDINFIIHTHQTFASLAGLTGYDINHIEKKSSALIGARIPLASYGLPGTKTLKNNIAAAVKRSSSNVVLMRNHGAICLGKDMENAFAVAKETEKVCKQLFVVKYKELTGKTTDSFNSLSKYISSKLMQDTAVEELPAYNSKRGCGFFELTPANGGKTVIIDLNSGRPLDSSVDCPVSAALHSMIYKKRKNVNFILHSKEPATLEVSKTGLSVKPFLDDFAQIVGISLKNAKYNPFSPSHSTKAVAKKLKHRDAVLIKHNGALCVGSKADEAEAVKVVAEKGCKAFFAATIFGKQNKHISIIDSAVMRFIYKTKYAKKK